MKSSQKSFLLYKNYENQIKNLTDEEAGQLLKAIFRYVNADEIQECENRLVAMVFSMVKNQLDIDSEKYQEVCRRRRDAANKRWCPDPQDYEANANASKSIQMDANASKSIILHSDIDIDTDKDKEKDKEKDKDDVVVDVVDKSRAHASGRTYEEIPLGDISMKDKAVLEELKGNESWLEGISTANHLASTDIVRRYLDEFAQVIANYNTSHQTRQELIIHFNNWLYKRIQIENQEQRNNNNQSAYGNNSNYRPNYESPSEQHARRDREQIDVGLRVMAMLQQEREASGAG